MLLLSTLLIFLSLSVAAIPLGPHPTRQIPNISRLKGLPLPDLPALPALPLLDRLPKPEKLLGRFIMDADYSSGSSPPAFFGKSPHKRADPLSNMFRPTTLRYNDVKEEIPPPNVA